MKMEETKILKNVWEVHPFFTGCFENPEGTRRWLKKGSLHRSDGPAVESADGSKEWFIRGKIEKAKYGTWLTPGNIYKLSGRISGSYFNFDKGFNKIYWCLVLENRKEKIENISYFFSKIILKNQILDLIFDIRTFEKVE